MPGRMLARKEASKLSKQTLQSRTFIGLSLSNWAVSRVHMGRSVTVYGVFGRLQMHIDELSVGA